MSYRLDSEDEKARWVQNTPEGKRSYRRARRVVKRHFLAADPAVQCSYILFLSRLADTLESVLSPERNDESVGLLIGAAGFLAAHLDGDFGEDDERRAVTAYSQLSKLADAEGLEQ